MKITKSPVILKSKPKTGKVKTSVIDVTTINTLPELHKIVLENPFNPSEASGIKTKDWISQQIFVLDFDGGFSIDEFLVRCRKLSLIPNIIYSTFSDTPDLRKFRGLFILDKKIEDAKMAKYIQLGLLKLFPEADPNCKDLCRMYYPGKTILHSVDELNESDFFSNFLIAQNPKNERFYNNNFKIEDDGTRPEMVMNFNWKNAFKKVKILDMFFNENVRVSYNILFGLATNLQYVEGGMKMITERMKHINSIGGATYYPDEGRGIETYPKDYFLSLIGVKKFNYKPTMLSNFSPFPGDIEFHNLLELNLKKGEIEILKEKQLISLQSAEFIMRKSFDRILKDTPFDITYDPVPDMITGFNEPIIKDRTIFDEPLPKYPIYLFKATTGLGKTKLITSLKNTLIAFPTHRLKDEVSNRMCVPHLTTPETPIFSNETINNTIQNLRDAGLYTEVTTLINSISNNKPVINRVKQVIDSNDILMAKTYILQNSYCRSTTDTVLTTHTRAINDNSFGHRTIIFDEDPLNYLLEINSCSLDFSVFDNTSYKSFVANLEDYLRNKVGLDYVINNVMFSIPTGFKRFCASINRGDIIKLLHSELLFRDSHNPGVINYCNVKRLPEFKKVIIMSATVPIAIYKYLYKDRLVVIEIDNIEPMGVIEQYTKRSFSMSQMIKYNTNVYNELFNNIDKSKVITHSKYMMRFKGEDRLVDDNGVPHMYYFGNCSGGDKLKGNDIAVIGTPNKPQFVYLFIAELIGLLKSEDTSLYDQIVEWGDYRFRFYTYGSQVLREIQLSLIESELLQAAGRGRFLRENNTTKIFSALPLKITTKFKVK